MSTNIARVFSWSAARERDEMLELYDRKLSRTVLRRESGSNPADLAGNYNHRIEKHIKETHIDSVA